MNHSKHSKPNIFKIDKLGIGHFAEAQLLQALNVDCVDESEVLTAADEVRNH